MLYTWYCSQDVNHLKILHQVEVCVDWNPSWESDLRRREEQGLRFKPACVAVDYPGAFAGERFLT